jgi:hypothetical protein
MLYREMIAVCFEIQIKQTNTLCGQNVEFFLNFMHRGTYSNHWALMRECKKKFSWVVLCLCRFSVSTSAYDKI